MPARPGQVSALRAPRSNRRQLAITVLSILGMLLSLLAMQRSLGSRQCLVGSDFRALYTGALMLRMGVRSDFYKLATQYEWQRSFAPELREQGHLMVFVNPPFLALLTLPLSFLPFAAAYWVWAGANVLLMLALARVLLFSLADVSESKRLRALFLALTFLPVWVTVYQGQYSFTLAISLLMAWRALARRQEVQAGLWLAALLIRPQLLSVPALLFLWWRRWRALAGLALGAAALLAVSLLAVGSRGLQGYVQLLQAALSWGDAFAMHPQRMYTWRSFLHLLMRTDNVQDVLGWWALGSLAAIALFLWACSKGTGPSAAQLDLQWALAALVAIFVSPHANFHDLTLLLVPFFLLMRHVLPGGSAHALALPARVLPAVAYFLVPASLFLAPSLRTQPVTCFLALAIVWLAWCARRLQPAPAS